MTGKLSSLVTYLAYLAGAVGAIAAIYYAAISIRAGLAGGETPAALAIALLGLVLAYLCSRLSIVRLTETALEAWSPWQRKRIPLANVLSVTGMVFMNHFLAVLPLIVVIYRNGSGGSLWFIGRWTLGRWEGWKHPVVNQIEESVAQAKAPKQEIHLP